MAYTATNWLELSMSTAQKLTALDNLESMYSQAVSYIDAITHSSSYYTDAQAAARYFSADTDGSGTGLVAATLDGSTADEIIAGGTPSGSICWWSGSDVSVPAGWYVCNGLNGTPDLRNKFIVGAGSHYSKGDTGGANTVTTEATITIAGHSLTATEIAKHTHGTITDYYASTSLGYHYGVGGSYVDFSEVPRDTGPTGSGNAHTHDATYTGTGSQAKIPPYLALYLIMKS